MAKFIFSLGEENFKMLAAEAKARDITIQELIRAVIIPDWMRHNLDVRTHREPASVLQHTTGFLSQRNNILPSSVGRLKT